MLHAPLLFALQLRRNYTECAENSPMPAMHSESQDTSLLLRLFGACSLCVEGKEVTGLSRPVKWLLALLAVHHNTPLSREWLAATLWPEATHERSAFYLRRSLMQLRTALGSQQHRLCAPPRAAVRLDLSHAFCDLVLFDRLVEAEETTAWESAISLYRGVILEGCGMSWALIERERCRERYVHTLERLADQYAERGNLLQAIQLLRRVVEADPLREETQRRLMETLGHMGDYTGVELQYRELRRALRIQLNMEPAKETVTLYQQLRVHVRTEQTFPPSSAPREIAFRNLPQPLTSFVGRTEERELIHVALQSGRLVTLVGPGGVGKTRLALSVGQMEEPNYPAGVCFVDLSATRTEADLLPALLAAFHLTSDPNVELLQALLRFLRPKRLLLILDNAEQIAEPCAHVAHILLQGCPQLTILCTSRQPLYLTGEIVLNISPLAIPEAQANCEDNNDDFHDLIQCSSVALLLDRIGTAAPDFRLDASNASAMAAICRRLEGLPLALELVAARFRSLSAPEIAHRLDLRFRLLNSANPSLPRHRSLHATLDWSYDLLSEAEQTLFRHLAVFRGGWTLEAVEAVSTTGEATVSLLSSLVDKSLVVYERQAGQERYRLLEMTRQYASERLEEQEQAEIEQRHAEYFFRWAASYESAQSGMLPSQNAALLPEQDNFQAAYQWFLSRDAEAALWLECFLYEARVWPRDNWMHRVAQIEQIPLSLTPRGFQIAFWSGQWALWSRHYAAESLLLRLLENARLASNTKYQGKALDLLCALELQRNNFDQARERAESWLRLAPPEADACEISAHRSISALYLARTGKVEQALHLLEAQLEEERQREDWQSFCVTSRTLGEMLLEQQEYRAAQPYLEQATALTAHWYPQDLTYLWRFQAKGAIGLADYGHAWHCLEQALRISRQKRQKDREAWTRWDMAELAFQEGRRNETETQMLACILALKENEEELNISRCLLRLAKYCMAWGQPARSVTLLGNAQRGIENLGMERTEEEERLFRELVEQTGMLLEKRAWQAAWKHGEHMTLDQAIDFLRVQK